MNTPKTALLACLLILAGCSPNSKPEGSQTPDTTIALATNLPPGQAAFRFAITGMTCQGCVGGLRSELLAATGVKAAEVSLPAAQAVVVCETNRTDAAQLLKVIKEAGFTGKLVSP